MKDGIIPEPSENIPAVTVNQALASLGVSNHTLAKWMQRLDPPIVSTRHPLDFRIRMLSAADVERIREARESIPRATTAPPRGPRIPASAPRPRQHLPTHAQEPSSSPTSAQVIGDTVKLSTLAYALNVPAKTAKEALVAGHFPGFKESNASNAAWFLDEVGQAGFRQWVAEVYAPRSHR